MHCNTIVIRIFNQYKSMTKYIQAISNDCVVLEYIISIMINIFKQVDSSLSKNLVLIS